MKTAGWHKQRELIAISLTKKQMQKLQLLALKVWNEEKK